MKKSIGILSVVGLSVMMMGCANYQKVDHQLVSEPDRISLQLATAMDKASASLQLLAAIEQAKSPDVSVSSVVSAPQELRRTITIDWTGPIAPIAHRLADRAGYEFAEIGQNPPVPVIVSISAVNKAVIDVLRDVGLQSGRRADIVVDAERHIVEVNYAPVVGE